ncbi:MAG TPA: Rrf2 family transcriptional regulator [Polyangiaceae bacterium]|nr:Rrf2 family transcriptional regulator [Polyangiaceae bacterium]
MVTRKTVYALRALSQLANVGPGQPLLAAEIAANEGIPRRFLDTILRQLTRSGLLTSSRGPHGGYSLRAPASQIKVAAVIRVLDGAAFPFPCLNWDHPVRCVECPGPGACAAHAALGVMGDAALRVLESMSLADLVNRLAQDKPNDSSRPLTPLRRSPGAPVRELP